MPGDAQNLMILVDGLDDFIDEGSRRTPRYHFEIPSDAPTVTILVDGFDDCSDERTVRASSQVSI